MTIDLSHVSWHDVLLIGVIVGMWIGQRGRRDQGKRIGDIEKDLTRVLAAVLGFNDSGKRDKPSDPGRPRT